MKPITFLLCFFIVHITLANTIIHQDDFNNCGSISWDIVAGASDSESFDTWKCTTFGGRTYMEIYDNDGNNDEDWLISPAFNLDLYNKEYFSFQFDNSSDINGLTLFYSTDYSGAGTSTAISNASWTSLSLNIFDIDNDSYTSNFNFQRAIDLSSISGASVHLAFRFESTGSTQGWGIENVYLTGNYYEDIINNIGNGSKCEDLKADLHNLIKGHERIEYTDSSFDVWDAFYVTDSRLNDAGTATIVYDVYSDNPSGAEPYEYTLGLDKDIGITTNIEGNYYNREHVFPQSWWGGSISTDTQFTDIQHILPSDQYVNVMKSNFPMGVTNNPWEFSINGCEKGNSSLSGYSLTIFEPIDEYKGDFARILLYMAVRYQYKIPSWESNFAGAMSTDTYTSYEPWLLENLICWHEIDPVSTKEINRNNAVYSIQKNRNPFIDHPEYVFFIWGSCGNVACPATLPVELSGLTAQVIGHSNIQLDWNTLSEINSSHFEMEHSLGGIHFNALGSTLAQGESNQPVSYRFVHQNAFAGVNYYRLKSVDIDGYFEYSPIVSADLELADWFHLQTNIIHTEIQFTTKEMEADVELMIYNSQGILMYQDEFGTGRMHCIHTTQWPAGIYFLQSRVGALVETQRIFVK